MSNKTAVIIPVYNNATTLRAVVEESLRVLPLVIVVDDGCTDANISEMLKDLDVTVLHHETNRGKGAALKTALAYCSMHGNITHMITIDADGQHFPEDIRSFLKVIDEKPQAVHVGCRDFNTENVPSKSRFGRDFSNFWFHLETGKNCADTQSGFRAYPVALIAQLPMKGSNYDFEVEVLCRAAWANIEVCNVPVRVRYDVPGKRITHFKPFKDNLRISLMHTRLIGRMLLPWPHKKLIASQDMLEFADLLRHPSKFFMYLMKENSTPSGLAAAAAVGSLIAITPLYGLHSWLIIYAAVRLHLNKVMAFMIQHIYVPPFVPMLCIEVGYYVRNGRWLTDFGFDTFKAYWKLMLLDWGIGSLILGPIFSAIVAGIVYLIADKVRKDHLANNHHSTEGSKI